LNYRGYATSFFGTIADRYETSFQAVKDTLPKADIKIAFRTYMSVTLLTTAIVYVAALIATVIIAQNFLKPSLLMLIFYLLFIPILTAVMCFLLFNYYPYQKASSRQKNIEVNLPFVMTHMGAIAESGVPPQIIFQLMAQFKEYGEVSREMEKIVRNINMFGIDPLTSVKEVAQKTPSDSLRQLLYGFVTTTESGGNIKTYLKNAGTQALFEWRMKRERFLQQLSAYAEFYTGLLIAAPLFMIAIFAVMNMIQPTLGGYTILDLMKLSIYVIIPLLNSGFLLFLRGVEVEM
jgi:flagellar protein FlaJ